MIWVDAQLSPAIAAYIREELKLEAVAVRDLGLHDAGDELIFEKARIAGAVLMSKDSDFVDLVLREGPPPRLLWITCGNCSNAALQAVLKGQLKNALDLLQEGEPVVEIA
jgi:predicted nuclease of predicted toxin-antitoxin system